MTEAANVLHVTQPTLSRQIADLETELGKKLFIRTNRNTRLTEDGIHLRQRAEEILSLVRQTTEEIKDDDIDLTGTIRIGAGETRIAHWLADTFAALHRQHPHVLIELFTGNADTVEDRLAHGLLDLALFIDPFHSESYNYIRLPEKDRLGIVTNINSPWAVLQKITVKELARIPLIIPSRVNTPIFDFHRWSKGKITAEDLHIVGKTDLIGNASFLAQNGIASIITLEELFKAQLPKIKFIPLDPPFEVSAVVAWKKYRLLSRSCTVFLKMLQEKVEAVSTN